MHVPDSISTPLRPITPRASRRSWNEPVVRGWWISTVVLLFIVGGLLVQQLYVARNSRYRLQHWQRINAATIEKIGREGLKTFRASPEMLPSVISKISYVDAAGIKRELEGYLLAQTAALRPGETIPILIDPAHPDHWTDRVTPLPIIEEMISPILLLPLPLFCLVAVFWQRRRILRIWQTGIPREARVLGRGNTAVAPGSMVLQCVFEGPRGNRIVKVTLPRSAGRFERDDLISLIAPTQDSGLAIASVLYE